MLLKSSSKSIIFPHKKLKIQKKLRKWCLILLLNLNSYVKQYLLNIQLVGTFLFI